MAEVAEGPELAEAMDCGRVLVMIPETGSVFVAGHSPLGAFLREAQVEFSLGVVCGAAALACEEAVEAVEVVDACEDKEDDELERCALFRGINTGRNSSGVPLVALPVHLF